MAKCHWTKAIVATNAMEDCLAEIEKVSREGSEQILVDKSDFGPDEDDERKREGEGSRANL